MRKLEQKPTPISQMSRKQLVVELKELRRIHAQEMENYRVTDESMELFMHRSDYYYAKVEAYRQALAVCKPTKLDSIIKHANEQAIALYKMYRAGMAFHLVHDPLPFVNLNNNTTDPL